MYHHYNVLHPFRANFLFPAIASIIHASHFPLQSSHFPFARPSIHTAHWQAYNLPEDNETGRVGSSIIELQKRNDVRINGQSFFQPAELSRLSPGGAKSILIQATPFFNSYTIITLIPNRSVTICIHHPPSLPSHFTFYPLPAITPRDEVDRLISSFSYPPHSFLFYFSTYTTFLNL
jgi:hypothetical protein